MVGVEAIAVDDDMLRPHTEPIKSAMHGCDARTQYIESVYLMIVERSYRTCHSLALYERTQSVTFLFAELLRVIETLCQFGATLLYVEWQYDRSSIYRTCEATAPSLIATSLDETFAVEYGLQHDVMGGLVEDLKLIALPYEPFESLGQHDLELVNTLPRIVESDDAAIASQHLHVA